MTDLDLAQPTAPSITLNRALIIFIASILAMIPGWILGAYIPLWLAPPVENLGSTFLFYLLTPCLLWGCVPFLLFRRWKISFGTDNSNRWMLRYAVLFVTWLIVFTYTFGQGYGEMVFFYLSLNYIHVECITEETENGNVAYTCDNSADYKEFFGCCSTLSHPYTFEGREGLPFVWYTGEIIPEQNGDD